MIDRVIFLIYDRLKASRLNGIFEFKFGIVDHAGTSTCYYRVGYITLVCQEG
jgi:hypothetical protein